MLPDFPKIKNKFKHGIDVYMRNLVRQDPIFSQIREEMHFEGNRMETKTMDGGIDAEGYKEITGEIKINKDEIIEKGPLAFIQNIQQTAEEIKKQKAEMLLKKVSEISAKVGTSVDAKGEPLTFDVFMKVLDKLWIDFDENGNPHMSTLVISPKMAEKMKERIIQWEKDPECKKRYDALMDRKRKEWNDRESHRKLVD